MKPVTEQELISHNAIFIKNITQGLSEYPNRILSLEPEGYRVLIRSLIERNKGETFVDFYYSRLTGGQQEKLMSSLTAAERQFITHTTALQESIYFQLEEQDAPFVEILCKLNERELLFTTFYFTGTICSLWGNWGLQYPVFWKDDGFEGFLDDIVG